MDLDLPTLLDPLSLAVNPDVDAEAEEARPPPIGHMVFRPALRKRNAGRYVTARAWRAATKKADLADIKIAKHAFKISPKLVAFAAEEIQGVVTTLFGSTMPWTVSVIATGHSRRPDAFARQIAEAVAAGIRRPFQPAFLDRYTSGSSHPKENEKLPPLVLVEPLIKGPVLIVDDIATSGWHMEEAAARLRAIGCTTFGVVWLGGNVRK